MPKKKQILQDSKQNPGPKTQDPTDSSTTGIIELDGILGGGFPKGAVTLLAGSSGSGKTIFAFQWLFEGIRNGENGIYITITEPLFKTLKNLETMEFYDRSAVEEETLKILDIRDIYSGKGFDTQKILDYIEQNVKETNAKRLCIDSITAIAYNLDDKAKIRKFIFDLGKTLASLGCTSILTSETSSTDGYSVYGVEEFIADAIIRFDQLPQREEIYRMMRIIKVRGREYNADSIYFRISKNGFLVFPKLRLPLEYVSTEERISIGNAELDKMLCGGILRGSSSLIVGSTGTGKSILSMQAVAEGLKNGEHCLYCGFEEGRPQIIRNAKSLGWDFEEYEKNGLLTIRCAYPSQKFLEEHLLDIKKIVEDKKIKRCIVDSVSAISNSFADDSFGSFVKRLNGYMKSQGVTSFFTSASTSFIGGTTLTESRLSTMTDNILTLRYIETEGELSRVINIVKVRGSSHSKELRSYKITEKGIVIGESLSGYEGIMSGITRKVSETIEQQLEAEFRRTLGPMGESVYLDAKEKGLTSDSLGVFVDDLVSQKILKKEAGEKFKENLRLIMKK